MNQRYCEHGRFEQRCGLCNDSPELKKLFDLSKVIGGKQ